MIHETVQYDEETIGKIKEYKKRARLGQSLQLSSLAFAAISLYFAIRIYVIG